jgi:transcriptional regulator with XRE-family HTH domain
MKLSSIPGACLQYYASAVPAVKDLLIVDEIPDRLRKVRQAEGLSVRDMAAMLESAGYDVSHGSVSSYENAGARVPADYVALVAKLFNRNPRWLLTGEGIEEDAPPSEAEQTLALVRQMVAIRPDQFRPMKPVDDDDASDGAK